MSSFWCSFWSTHFDDELSHFIYNTVVSFHFVSFHSFWVYEMRQLIIKMSSSKWTSKWVHQNHHNELSHFTLSHFTHFELSEVGLDGAVCISVAVLQCELQCEMQCELQSEMQCVGVGLMVHVYPCVVRSCLIVLLLRLITMYDSGIQSSFWVVRSCPIDLLLRLITTYESGIQSSESSHSNDWMPLSGVATISRLLEMIGLFCKRALQNRRYSAKATCNFKEPTNCSHPIWEYDSDDWMPLYEAFRRVWMPLSDDSLLLMLIFTWIVNLLGRRRRMCSSGYHAREPCSDGFLPFMMIWRWRTNLLARRWHTATHCNTLQHTATRSSFNDDM